MKQKQKGFSALALLITITVIAIVSFIGWYVWQNKGKKDTSAATQVSTQSEKPQPKPAATAPLQTYKQEDAKLTFQHPENWKHEADEVMKYDDGRFGGISGTLTSPTGNKLTWVFMAMGGRGGDCQPDQDDKPFAPGNKCSTKQILSAEKVQSPKPVPGIGGYNLFKDNLFITRTKHRSAADKVQYTICLDPFYTSKTETRDDDTPTVGTKMGLYLPCEFWQHGFNATFVVKDEAAFNSAEAKTAEAIMKSFNTY